jgi:hypothetical protein
MDQLCRADHLTAKHMPDTKYLVYTHTQAAHTACVHAQHQAIECACSTTHTHTSSESHSVPDQAVDQGEQGSTKYKLFRAKP